MSTQEPQDQDLGRLDDEQEDQQASDTTDGPAAEGEYDAPQGAPDGGQHPTGAPYPVEATRFEDPEPRPT